MNRAFFISGHGDERPEFYTVPPGTIVVVRVHSGEVSHFTAEEVARLCILPIETLRDPLHHSKELIDAFGSLAFYTEGMQCPTFVYTPVSFYNYTSNAGRANKLFTPMGSGVIDIERLLTDDFCRLDSLKGFQQIEKAVPATSDYDPVARFIVAQFRNSVHPTSKEVEEYLGMLKTGGICDRDEYSTLDTVNKIYILSRFLGERFSISQEALSIKLLSDSKNPPDVYYNFVCRDTPIGQTAIYNPTAPLIPHQGINAAQNRRNILNMANPNVKSTIRKHISEAEFQRKAAIRNWNILTHIDPGDRAIDIWMLIRSEEEDAIPELTRRLAELQEFPVSIRRKILNEPVSGSYLLREAVRLGNTAVIKLLVQAGADPTIGMNDPSVTREMLETLRASVNAPRPRSAPSRNGKKAPVRKWRQTIRNGISTWDPVNDPKPLPENRNEKASQPLPENRTEKGSNPHIVRWLAEEGLAGGKQKRYMRKKKGTVKIRRSHRGSSSLSRFR
jgi:hypothetical protein